MQSKTAEYSDVYNQILAMHTNNQRGLPKKEYFPAIKTVISVSGAAAVGKTTFCKELAEFLITKGCGVTHIQLDGYQKTREERKQIQKSLSGYDPKSCNLSKLLKDMHDLIYDGKIIQMPVYDHSTGKAGTSITVKPAEVIILDGIRSMHDEVRIKFSNFSIFMYGDDATLKELRLQADVSERGYSSSDALAHSEKEFNAYTTWIQNQIRFANMKLLVNKDRTMKIVE